MTTCDDETVERHLPDLSGGGDLIAPELDESFRIRGERESHDITARVEYDVHSAVVRGLAAYIAGLESALAGRVMVLDRVVDDWAEHNDGSAQPPSAVVSAVEEGKYQDDGGMQYGSTTRLGPPSPDKVLVAINTAIYRLEDLQISVMCADKVQRRGVRHMLEDALYPNAWAPGFDLVLTRYHSATASYALMTMRQPDETATAQASIWPLTVKLKAWCPVYRLHRLPLARVVARGTIG